MSDVPQMEERCRYAERYAVGKQLTEHLIGGGTREWTVTEFDAEPKYPLPEDRPYVRMSTRSGKTQIMSCRVIDAVDWIVPAPLSHEGTGGSDA